MIKLSREKGQMMLLQVLILSIIISIVTALAGLLITFQLRQVTDAKASGEAIFGADSGIECVLFHKFGPSGVDLKICPNPGDGCPNKGAESRPLPDGPSFNYRCLQDTGGEEIWLSVGQDSNKRVARAFQIRFIER